SPSPAGVHLLPKLRCYFAEFLNPGSLERLGIFSPPTCVGLGYGRHSGTLTRSFSWKRGIIELEAPGGPPHHLSALAARLWPSPPTLPAYWLERPILMNARLSSSVPPRETIRAGAGMFACFPSPTPFGLGLGTD